MAARIFSIEEDGHLLQMDEEACRTEDEFQDLLSNYPELLGGDEIDSSSPRRWLLVKREMGVPAGEEGEERWSLDHLFLDQDGVPTLVEVKRISDTRIRRTVVAQMLDYAANAVVYWPVERIRAAFEAGEADAAEKLAGLLGEGSDPEQFWAKVKTNLQAGRIRMLFVADAIPPELRRIVEFLNEQMDPVRSWPSRSGDTSAVALERSFRGSSAKRRRQRRENEAEPTGGEPPAASSGTSPRALCCVGLGSGAMTPRRQ